MVDVTGLKRITRKFGKTTYTITERVPEKTRANKIAAAYRKEGCGARVVKLQSNRIGSKRSYGVYTSNKSKRKRRK